MNYQGSKRRIAKEILPIILKDRKPGQWYVEPFCGGCNTIDKVSGERLAADSNPYLIAMFNALLSGWKPPIQISREYYNDVRDCYNRKGDDYPMHYIGWIGFTASYRGKFFGGYSGHNVNSRDYISESQRNILKQIPNLQRVMFECCEYKDLIIPEQSIIYCDPPYENTTEYADDINHDEFWDWCRQKAKDGHKVFISEYNAPEDFTCIWQKELRKELNLGDKEMAIEKLFVYTKK